MKWKNPLLVLIVGLQCGWVLRTAVVQEQALSAGAPILLETAPVDPRDLLRGDYVILNYKISTLNSGLFQPSLPNEIRPGQTVYVGLECVKGEFWEAVTASTQKLPPTESRVVLKGRVEHSWGAGAGQTIRIAYGLEKFYVREGTGNPRGKLTVQVGVPRSGNGRIKQVFVDGTPYAEAMR